MDLTPQCELRERTHYEYAALEQIDGAAELIGQCSVQIWRSPDAFEFAVEGSDGGLEVSWRSSSATAGIAVLRDAKQTLQISVLASGVDANSDGITLEAFGQHIVRLLRNTPFEPAFDLREVMQRPLVATIGLFLPAGLADRKTFALIDRCFAAAYFRKLGLA